MKNLTKSASFLFVLTLFASIGMAQSSGYHLIGKIEVGGEGGWDYLIADSEAHRLYVSHASKSS